LTASDDPGGTAHDWGAICNTRDLSRYVPFVAGGFHLGWIHRARVGLVRAEPVFTVFPDLVVLDEGLATPAQRTAAVAELAHRWRELGVVPGWRDELYDVVPYPGGPVVMRMERALTRLFGLINIGAHVNGYVRDGADVLMWVARRSPDKPTYPGLLDQMVAGGVIASMTPEAVARKEAWEEAGIGAGLIGPLRQTSAVTMFMEHGDVISRDVEHVFDLELPADFVPRPVDAEVAGFELYPVDELLDVVTGSAEFKPDCNLVVLDFLIRHDHLRAGDPLYQQSVLGLRRGVL
jgi:8-oxo-dGTP pyrophosphatase MutT (NUDIX family)